MPPKIISHGLSGLGPRNAQLITNLALIILIRRDKLNALKAKSGDFVLHLTAFEKNDESNAGNAYQLDCDAAVNTGIPGLPDIPGIEKVDPVFLKHCNLAETVAEFLQTDYDNQLAALKARNPIASLLLKHATRPDGTIDTSLPCATRGQWGRIELDNFKKILGYIKENIPELVVSVHYHHEVICTDFSDPQRPVIVVKKIGENIASRHAFDFVTFAHGTPLVSAFAANPKIYSQTPNHDTLRAFLHGNGILDDEGYIKPGRSIAMTGIGLAFLDYTSLLLPFLRCFRRSAKEPAGFEIDRDLAKQHQGLLTVVSRRENGPAPPRPWPWRMDARPDYRPMVTTEEMHAMRLQGGFDWIEAAQALMEADTARSLRKTPSKSDFSVEELMRQYAAETAAYLRGDENQEASRMAQYSWALVGGFGFEPDQAEAEKQLLSKAPLSRSGCVGWELFNASGFEMSDLSNFDTKENSAYFKGWRRMHNFAAGAIPLIQYAAAELFNSGIAQHDIGTFDEIKTSDGVLSFRDRQFDIVLSPTFINRDADVLRDHVHGVKNIVLGMPDYGKGMHFKTKDGEPIHAFDVGLGGWGKEIKTMNGRQVIGKRLAGTNAHRAAVTWSIGHAEMVLLHAFASFADPQRSPVETVFDWYQAIRPKEIAFATQAQALEPVWDNLQEKLGFIRLCWVWACNGEDYLCLTEQAFEKTSRDAFIERRSEDDRKMYASILKRAPRFAPRSLWKWEESFPFYRAPQLAEMWKHAEARFLASNAEQKC